MSFSGRKAAEKKHKASGKCMGDSCSHHSHYDDGGKVPAPSSESSNDNSQRMHDVSQGAQNSGGFPSLDTLKDRVKHAFDPDPHAPAGMAEGGRVRSGKTRHQNEKGIHSESFSYDKPGKSDSGVYIRSHGSTSDKSKSLLRTEHEDIMGQQSKINPKLKGLAHGGEVHKDRMNMYAMKPDVPAMHGMAEGGEIEPEMEGDHELHEAIAGELCDALERKDKKQIMDSMRAIVMACGGKV